MGFGGVIEKEYESFIENIEKDLINDKTLKDEINNEKFKNSLKEIINEDIDIVLELIQIIFQMTNVNNIS